MASKANAGTLDGRVALITGGASGLGLTVARLFVKLGAHVGILDRVQSSLDRATAELGSAALGTLGDVTSMDDNARAVERTVASFGRLDVFVGNAGIFDNYVSLVDLPPEKIGDAFDEVFGIDVKGYLLGAKAALPHLQRSRGSIVFTASNAGLRAGYGGIIYTAAKHAVIGITRRLALELAPDVRVNAVAPGYMPTSLAGMQTFRPERTPSPKPAADRFPLHFIPTAEDYASFYAFLASDHTRMMTGEVMLADGGLGLKRT